MLSDIWANLQRSLAAWVLLFGCCYLQMQNNVTFLIGWCACHCWFQLHWLSKCRSKVLTQTLLWGNFKPLSLVQFTTSFHQHYWFLLDRQFSIRMLLCLPDQPSHRQYTSVTISTIVNLATLGPVLGPFLCPLPAQTLYYHYLGHSKHIYTTRSQIQSQTWLVKMGGIWQGIWSEILVKNRRDFFTMSSLLM